MNTLTDLRELISRLAATTEHPAWIPGMQVLATSQPGSPMGALTQPMLALTAHGAKSTLLGDLSFDYQAGQYLIAGLDLPLTARITRADPFLAFGLPLRPEIITRLLMESALPPASAPSGLGIAVADADAELIDAVVRLLRLVERPLDFAMLAPDIEREIHWRLLTGPLTGLVRQIGRSDDRVSAVARAARWINERFDQIIRIDDLARQVGVSVPTLNRYFRTVTAMSPLQYQKQIRLQQARIRLASAPDDVAAIGHGVGYDSLSQFSREYRRMYGEPPGRDARRLQEAMSTEA